MKAFLGSALVLACLAGFAAADDGLPADVLQKIKAATVYLKPEIPGHISNAWGGGFVFKVDGQTVLIATNSHVLEPVQMSTTVKEAVPATKTTAGKTTTTMTTTTKTLTKMVAPTQVSVVFDSGTKTERVQIAEVVMNDTKSDFAVLRVLGMRDPPAPIDIADSVVPAETASVYVFGFPYGTAFSLDKGNPTIAVRRGMVSSIVKGTKDGLPLLVLDGIANVGNQGGVAVDANGKFVGSVVDGKIRFTGNISFLANSTAGSSFVMSRDQIDAIMRGQVELTGFNINFRNDVTADLKPVVKVMDPLRKISAVSLLYMPAEEWKRTSPSQLTEAGGAQKLPLALDTLTANGMFSLDLGDKGLDMAFQLVHVNDQGKSFYSEVKTIRFAGKQAAPPLALDPAVANPDEMKRLLDELTKQTKGRTLPPDEMQKLVDELAKQGKAQANPVVVNVATATPADIARCLEDLKSPTLISRAKAAQFLSKVKPNTDQRDDVIKGLTPLLGETSIGIKRDVVHALGNWGGKDQIPLLMQFVDGKDPPLRDAAIEALGSTKDPAALDILTVKIHQPVTRTPAGKGFIAFGSDAEPVVLRILAEGDNPLRLEAMRILKMIGTEASILPLQVASEMNDTGSPTWQTTALEAIAAIRERGRGQ